jgi:hypothetical protein
MAVFGPQRLARSLLFVGRVGPKQTHRCELAISEVGRPVADMRSEAPNVQLLLQMDP